MPLINFALSPRVCRIAAPLFLALLGSAQAASENRVDRLIVKLRDSASDQVLSSAHRQLLETRGGTRLALLRTLPNGAALLKLPHALADADAQALVAALRTDPDIEYVETDSRRYAVATPDNTEPLYAQQWYLSASAAGGMNLPGAWNAGFGLNTGTADGVVVAVVDSGYSPHVEFAGRILQGYDFISDVFTANDGGGRDSSALDPGDWVTSSDVTAHPNCIVKDSSWHGTFIAGVIAASGDNLQGIAGINGQARILPVRVLGRCGGFISDIADGMRWAAGLPVSGVPTNPNPARVINLSVDGQGTCSNTEQAAISAVIAAGTVVVVAAGNNHDNVSNYSPANCVGVITVAATNINGSLTTYSNTGSKVAISAPGGEFPDDILSTSNAGLTVPDTGPNADTYVSYSGTSFATAAVSGVVSLIVSARPELTAAQVRTVLESSAKSITDNACRGQICGAGIANAANAVSAAQSFVASSPVTSSGGGGGGGNDLLSLLALISLAWRRKRRTAAPRVHR